MKKWLKSLFVLGLVLVVLPVALSGCGKSAKTVKIGVVGDDEAETWQPAVKKLKGEGINLQITKFTDYNQPNLALKQKELDLNAYQTYVFFDNWKKANKAKLVSIGDTYFIPMAVYSNKIKNIKDVTKGTKVTLPNDLTNQARALKVLASAGLIKLDNAEQPGLKDITANKLKLNITPLDASQVARSLSDTGLAVINSNFAIDAGLNPKTSLFKESFTKDSAPYINLIATNRDQKNNATYKKVVAAYQTEATKQAIDKAYKSAGVPAWGNK